MKVRNILILVMALLMAAPISAKPKYRKGFLYREGRQLMLNGKPYRCVSFNSFQLCGCGHDYELFTDEGHFLLVFCDEGNGSFNCGYTVGTAASAIMDSEALDILADELNDAYNYAESDEEVFSDAFRNTADRIMSAADERAREETFGTVGIVVAVVAVVGVVAYVVVRQRKAKEAAEQKKMEDILNTPLEKFGEKDVEDLADKYEKDGPVSGDKD